MRFDAVIFDIDNVLIDTRASYTDCIRKTVETYLETILNFQRSRISLLSRRDVEMFKSLGGFNDDWDTCYGLLLYLLQFKTKKHSIHELEKQKNIAGFVRSVKPKPLGVKGLLRLLRAHRNWSHNVVDLSLTSPRNDVIARQGSKQGRPHKKRMGPFRFVKGSNLGKWVSLAKIADIFQRFYLSDFVWAEKLLISKSSLKQLKRSGLKIGIVTGRNHEEAAFALRRFKIDSLIDAMITTNDTPKQLKKPHPYGLLKIAEKLGRKLRYLYVGDLPDDILAARQAKKKIKILSCGYLAVSTQKNEMKQEFKRAGADYISKTPGELFRIASS